MRCEYQVNPLGLDSAMPRLGWILKSSVRGQRQTAYQVIVSSRLDSLEDNRGDLWNSEKVLSDHSIQVVYQGKPLASATRYYWKVRVWDKDGNPGHWSRPSWFETALLNPDDWTATWIDDGKSNPVAEDDFYKFDPAPLFRKEFALNKAVQQARLYITGLGYYEASLNGDRVGDHFLDPGWTNYAKRVYYSTYDVTEQLQSGKNCLAVMLGNGWYNPLPLRMWGRRNLREHLTVGRPMLIAQLHVVYADGSTHTIASDETWKVTEGPVLRNSIYLGEIYDARKEISGWNKAGFDDAAWADASAAGESVGPLQAQPVPPIQMTAIIKPVTISEPEKGVYIVDMGQNFAGLASFKFTLNAGTKVTIRYGELLYEDGTLNPMTSVCGQIKGKRNDSLESHPGVAWQSDIYFAKGHGSEVYTPRFTFHAFRYIEITGLPEKPRPEMITGWRLNSDVKSVGQFSCSNDMFNAIQTMCQWTFLSNIFSVQSDCPHRERFGYGGDLINTNEAYIYNYDMANFYAKAVTDWDDSKLENGMLTDTAPSVGIQYCGVGWAMPHPHTQLKLYQYYGDKRIIEQQYQTSKQWLDLVAKNNPTHIINKGLSDHESLTEKPPAPMVTPLYYQSAKMLAKMAGILGYEKDQIEYESLSEKIKNAYNETFFDANSGQCDPGTQSSQSFALGLDILPKENRAVALQYLLDDIRQHETHLTTGIFGTRYMLNLLPMEGYGQTAYDIVNQRTFPGWGYMLDNGATTLWEHWAYDENTFSHNHPMFGSVSQYFYGWLGGIQPHPDAVGFDRILIKPQVPKGLEWVHCTYESVRGTIRSHWRKTEDSIRMDIEIPANAVATVYLPCRDPENIKESNCPVDQVSGVRFERYENGTVVYTVESGKYHFAIPYDPSM